MTDFGCGLRLALDGLLEALVAAVARGDRHKSAVVDYFGGLREQLKACKTPDSVAVIARDISVTGKITELGLSDVEQQAYDRAFEAAQQYLREISGPN